MVDHGGKPRGQRSRSEEFDLNYPRSIYRDLSRSEDKTLHVCCETDGAFQEMSEYAGEKTKRMYIYCLSFNYPFLYAVMVPMIVRPPVFFRLTSLYKLNILMSKKILFLQAFVRTD